jgi:hypothetical protein
MRLSPLDPEMFRMQAGMSLAHLFAGRFDTASSWAEQSFRQLPSFLLVVAIIAASHALAGRAEQARTAVERLQALNPLFRVTSLANWIPIRRAEHLTRFETGLRLAGLPE